MWWLVQRCRSLLMRRLACGTCALGRSDASSVRRLLMAAAGTPAPLVRCWRWGMTLWQPRAGARHASHEEHLQVTVH